MNTDPCMEDSEEETPQQDLTTLLELSLRAVVSDDPYAALAQTREYLSKLDQIDMAIIASVAREVSK